MVRCNAARLATGWLLTGTLLGCSSAKPSASTVASTVSSSNSSTTDSSTHPTLTDDTWRVLFDGHSTAAWRGYRKDSFPAGWQVIDGTLTRVGEAGDIITRDEFGDFELTLDWKVAEGSNSGIFYRVTEDGEGVYETGPEMQVLDDARHPDGRSRLTAAGSVFGIYPSPAGIVKPAGEWNKVRIVVQGNHVEHWLNGTKAAEYELASPDWESRVKASKFKQWPGYGRAKRGHIALQDHGDKVSFRDIKIRTLP
jgi:hypothetical protein